MGITNEDLVRVKANSMSRFIPNTAWVANSLRLDRPETYGKTKDHSLKECSHKMTPNVILL